MAHKLTIITNDEDFVKEIIEVAKKYQPDETAKLDGILNNISAEISPTESKPIDPATRKFKVTEEALKNPFLQILFAMEGDPETMTVNCPAADKCSRFLTEKCELHNLEEVFLS